MISKLQGREAAVAIISGEDWRDVARRLALLTLLVVGITAHAAQFFLSLRQFESGPPVAPTTYVARFAEIGSAEGRPYRDFPVEYPPVSLAAIEVAAGSNGNETGAHLVWIILLCDPPPSPRSRGAGARGPRSPTCSSPRRSSASCIRPSTSSP
jgi:hypothetical protein